MPINHFPSQQKNDKWVCKYCKIQNNKYEEICKRCGRGVAPELFLPAKNNFNPIVMIVFFFILVMIIIFSRLPQNNMKQLIKHYKQKIESNQKGSNIEN